MLNLVHLLDQYELLDLTAHHLYPVDLFNAALTCKQLHSIILCSKPNFERLKRVALCDGSGLKARRQYTGLFAYGHISYSNIKPFYDKEIEVRVQNLECDKSGGLLCLKCNSNVCEEYRFVLRVRDSNGWESCRRPRFNPAFEIANIVAYCDDCDVGIEEKYGEGLCDCDQFTRWICLRCRVKEIEEYSWYSQNRTTYAADDKPVGMQLSDHQSERAIWCPCGTRVSYLGNIRCIWCKRKHHTKIYPANRWHPIHRYNYA